MTVEYKFLLLTEPSLKRWTVDVENMADITEFVLTANGVAIDRGRATERDQITPSTATFTLDNSDRLFDPTNESGDYYGYLNVNQPMAIQVGLDGDWFTLFHGFVATGFPQADSGHDLNEVTITCIDTLGVLNMMTPHVSEYEAVIRRDSEVNRTRDRHYPLYDGVLSETTTGFRLQEATRNALVPSRLAGDSRQVTHLKTREGYLATAVPELQVPSPFANDLTIEFWLTRFPYEKAVWGLPGFQNILVQDVNSASPWGVPQMIVSMINNELEFRWAEGTTIYRVRTSTSTGFEFLLTDGNPHHIVIRCPGNSHLNWSISIDGDVALPLTKSTISVGPPYFIDSGLFHIGEPAFRSTEMPDDVNNLVVQDLQVWFDREMTDDEVTERFRAGRGALVGASVTEHVTEIAESISGENDTLVVNSVSPGRAIHFPLSSNGNTEVLTLLEQYEKTVQGLVWSTPTDEGSVLGFTDNLGFDQSDPYLTFSDENDGDYCYLSDSFVAEYDPLHVENVSSVARVNGAAQIVKNPDSVTAIGERSLDQLSNLLLLTDTETHSIAEWRSKVYSQPKWNISQLTLHVDDADLFKLMTLDPTRLLAVKRNGTTHFAHLYGASLRTEGDQTFLTLSLSGVRYQANTQPWDTLEWDTGNWF